MSLHAGVLKCGLGLLILGTSICSPSVAQDEPAKQDQGKKAEPFTVEVAKGALKFEATGEWEKVKPRNQIVEAEVKVPKVEGDKADGRLTIMGAGGTIELNIDRWQKQYTQPDGSDTSEKTKIEKKEINGVDVTMVDITGTLLDTPGGPFAGGKTIERPDYRMLAAIIETEGSGNYFVKLYGPEKTVTKNKKNFEAMVKSFKFAE